MEAVERVETNPKIMLGKPAEHRMTSSWG